MAGDARAVLPRLTWQPAPAAVPPPSVVLDVVAFQAHGVRLDLPASHEFRIFRGHRLDATHQFSIKRLEIMHSICAVAVVSLCAMASPN
jgi:hypothetical protein